jgi:hypothetical protein
MLSHGTLQISRIALHEAVSRAADRAVNARRDAIVEEVVREHHALYYIRVANLHQLPSKVS